MAISVTEVGIKQITNIALLVQSEIERSVEETEPVLNYDGTLNAEAAELFNPAIDFTFQGKGDLPAGLALATDAGFTHADLAGGVTLLLRVKDAEQAGITNNWEVSGKNRPTALVAA
ncbi:MAG: hypothetical protein QM496_13930 [Verrucomicrobiota bacterium]